MCLGKGEGRNEFHPSNAFSILVSVSNERFLPFSILENVLLTTIHSFSQLFLSYFHLLHFIKHLHSYFLRIAKP